MRFAVITNGVVTNMVAASLQFGQAQGWIASDTAEPGDLWDGNAFSKDPAAEAARVVAEAKAARRTEIDAALAADNGLLAIAMMTDAEYNLWFAANVTNAAQPLAELAKLVKRLVRYEARQLLK